MGNSVQEKWVEVIDRTGGDNKMSIRDKDTRISHNKIKHHNIRPRADKEPKKPSALDVENMVILRRVALLFQTRINNL